MTSATPGNQHHDADMTHPPVASETMAPSVSET